MKSDQNKNNPPSPSRAEARNQPNDLRKMLVAIDFSDFSKQALNYALTLAEKFDVEITLIHVIQPTIIPETLMVTTEPEVDMRMVPKAQEMLESLRRNTIDPAIPSTAIVQMGEPWEKIIEEAKMQCSDLIITASHGYSGLKDILLGSTAERVVRHAPCSVLTIRPAAAHAKSRSVQAIRLKKFLVPVDFSAASKMALVYAATLANKFGAEIVLEHVIETDRLQVVLGHVPHRASVAEGKIVKDAEDVLTRFGQQDIVSDISRQIVVKVGRPFKVITDTAETLRVDLILLTSWGREDLKRPLLGSTVERVVRHAHCAVWTIRR
jgi:nucleotide-binding universal stress UspA family protein